MRSTRTRKQYILYALATLLATGLLFSFLIAKHKAAPYEEKLAYVNALEYLNVRSAPSGTFLEDDGGSIIMLPTCTLVTIIGESTSSSGVTWYKIRFDYGNKKNLEGYVYGPYLKEYSEVKDDEYLAYLKQQGFPDSYCTMLMIVHSQHPTWIFEAQKTGLDWETSVTAEAKEALSYYSSPTSWKNAVDGSYDWDDDAWIGKDGSKWHTSSREIVAYFMDPRNHLNERSIFQFEIQSWTLKKPETSAATGTNTDTATGTTTDNATTTGTTTEDAALAAYWAEYNKVKSEVQNRLKGTFMAGEIKGEGITYAQAFMDAADASGVSPYMLVARVIQEMGNAGGSRIISGTVAGYENLYNYFDIGAYTTSEHDLITNGLIYASKTNEKYLLPWNTRYRSLVGGSIYLGSQYIAKGQDTLYLQKFNVQGAKPYSHQYMTNIQAANNEANTTYTSYNNLEQAFHFKIPVYENMPANAAGLPTKDGNPNAYLKTISADGFSLTPSFSYKTTTYDLVVPASVGVITLKGVPMSTYATVRGDGKKVLDYGLNTYEITCVSEYGTSITYTINIYRIESPERIMSTYVFKEDPIEGNVCLGVPTKTNVADFLRNVTVIGSNTKKLVNSDGVEKTSGFVATGDHFVTDLQDYTLVVLGDANGDGILSATDILYIRSHIMNVVPLTGEQLIAANASMDDKISALDILFVRSDIMDVVKLIQPTVSPTTIPTNTPVPTDTPVPTNTVTPSNTPMPTITLAPTNTPVPTNTVVPTNTPVPTSTLALTDTPVPTSTEMPMDAPIVEENGSDTSIIAPSEKPVITDGLGTTTNLGDSILGTSYNSEWNGMDSVPLEPGSNSTLYPQVAIPPTPLVEP